MQAVNGNNALRELFVEERKEIERILAELSGEVGRAPESIWPSTITVLTQLDCIFARAKLSFAMHGDRAGHSNGRQAGTQARAPSAHRPRRTVVPISLRLGVDFDTLVITGPNTGGKTVTLKTIGLVDADGGVRPAHPGGRRQLHLRL